VTKTLTIAGGTLEVPGADFQLVVPKNAFGGPPMTFTITAYPGKVIAYDFQPHGVKFIKPLQAIQGLSNTGWATMTKAAYATWAGAYFADFAQINGVTGTATINELMPCSIDPKTGTMIFDIPHFSGYMISTGRSDDGEGGE
jgi:hypothetical protein